MTIQHRVRMSGDTTRLNDKSKDYYSVNLKLAGDDWNNFTKIVERLTERLGVAPSNPMTFSYIMREFVKAL